MTAPRLSTALDVRESLGGARAVIVTGPQRSGTTFAAHAMAETLGTRVVDEAAINNSDMRMVFALLYEARTPFVLQAPGLTHALHLLPEDDRVAVVWMLRPQREITRSEKRVGWSQRGEPLLEAMKYQNAIQSPSGLPIASMKLWHWRTWQQASMRTMSYELDYHSPYLTEHPLRVAQADRAGWHIKQVRPEG